MFDLVLISEIKADFMKDMDSFGTMQPYISFTSGDLVLKTQTLRGKTVTFTNHLYLDPLKKWKVQAFEVDSLSDQLGGEATLPALTEGRNIVLPLILKDEKTCVLTIRYELLKRSDFEPGSAVNFYNLVADIVLQKQLTGDLPDPYLKIRQEDVSRATVVIQNPVSPLKWSENLVFPYKIADYMIELMDKDILKDDLMGFTQVHFRDLKGKEGTLTLPLTDTDKVKKGTLKFTYYRGDYQQMKKASKIISEQSVSLPPASPEKKKEEDKLYLYDFKGNLSVSKMSEKACQLVVSVDRESSKSLVVDCTNTPQWKECFCFPMQKNSTVKTKMDMVSVLKKSEVGSSTFTASQFPKPDGQKQVILKDSNGVSFATLYFKYSYKFNREAYLKQVADLKLKTDQEVQLPKQIVFYDIKTHLAENSDLVKEGAPLQVVISSGAATDHSGVKSSQQLKNSWSKAMIIRSPIKKIKVALANKAEIPLATYEGTIADFPHEEGVRKLQLSSPEGMTADLLLKYTKLPFEEQDYKEDQESRDKEQAKKANIKLSRIEFIPESNKDKPVYLLMEYADYVLRINSKKLYETKVPVEATKITFTERLNGQTLGDANIRTQKLFDLQKGSHFLELVNASNDRVGTVSFNYETTDTAIPSRGGIAAESAQQQTNPLIQPNPSIRSIFRRKLPQNYGDRIFDNQSAATMQNSILAYSFPKGERFYNKIEANEPSYYTCNSINKNKYQIANFGYGLRKPYPLWMERNMKEVPAPNSYDTLAVSHFERKGKTFGQPHVVYEKVLCRFDTKEKCASKHTLRPVASTDSLLKGKTHFPSDPNYHFRK